jgi:DNA-binding transcriptional regulator YhcF (GntR family)
MEKVFPAVEKAIRFVRQMIDKELTEGDHLPAIRKLAQAAGVSVSSMVKAIAELKRNKIVSGIERGPIYVGPEFAPVKAKPISNGKMWEKKRAAVQQDLMNGVFSHDRVLPSAKELQVRYGVCYRTMKKILDTLTLEKVIIPHKKSYILPGPEKKQ